MPEPLFTPAPNAAAAALIAGKPPVVKRVFNQLLPELRARAFTVAGIESANALQRIRDAVAAVPLGTQTWDQAKRDIVDELDPYLGDGADYRATLVLRTNGFQGFSSTIHENGMQDEGTTHFQYLHGECKAPTESHLALNGIVLPKDDEFWDTHTGPWGHLGCVCYKRPMNEDLVADEQAKDDAQDNPEDRNVLIGPALTQLHHGTFLRNGRRYDTSIAGPDNSGFHWSPGDFRIPLKDLESKYDPEVWSQFQQFAQSTMLNENQSLWDWLKGSAAKPSPPPIAGPAPEGIGRLANQFLDKKFSPQMVAAVRSLPPAIAPLLENLSVANAGQDIAHYKPSLKTMFLRRKLDDWYGTRESMIHEVGHHLHYQTGMITESRAAPEFQAAAELDWQNFGKWAEQKIGDDWQAKLSGSLTEKIDALMAALGYKGELTALPMAQQKRIARFGDTILGLSRGRYGFGHQKSYMQYHGLKEVFTHAWTGIVDNDTEFANLFSGVTHEVRRALNL